MRHAGLRARQDGVVFAEFLIAFLPFFLLFLATIQLSLIEAAHLVVQHAAVQAVRTATVTIDDDPCFHEGEVRGALPAHGKPSTPGAGAKVLALLGLSAHAQPAQTTSGGNKLQRVRDAAYLPLSVLAPTPSQAATLLPWTSELAPSLLTKPSLGSALGATPSLRIAEGLLTYNRVAAAINFPAVPHSAELLSVDHTYGPEDPVTVRVTYLFSCNVPLVRELMCDSLLELAGWTDAKTSIEALRKEPSWAKAQEQARRLYEALPTRLDEAGRLSAELAHSEWKWLVPALASPSHHFVVLRGEASLPNQGATYPYSSELGQAHCDGTAEQGGAS